MKYAVSYLKIENNLEQEIQKLDNLNIDFIHVDVMDGNFVDNKTLSIENLYFLKDTKTKKDVHLMVDDVEKYINDYKHLNPEYITFHIEKNNTEKYIKLIKQLNIKVGISINPNTDINLLLPYLPYIDLVLVMSVNPGYGGQLFIIETIEKLKLLKQLKKENNYNYLIEVDGGINDETINLINDLADIAVVGSFITNGDYNANLDKLRK